MIKKTLGLLSLALSIVLFSCSSDDNNSNTNNNPNNNPTTSSVIATIEGQSWSSTPLDATGQIENYDVGEIHNHTLIISGIETDQSYVTIQLPIENLSEGTFSYPSEDFYGILSYRNSPTGAYFSTDIGGEGSFTVTISNLNLTTGTISGTFSGTLHDIDGNSITITNGAFNIVTMKSSNTFSNGIMSLSKNGGDLFTMDSAPEDGKYLTITQHSEMNLITISGRNTNISSDMGSYVILIPKNAAIGTYNLMTESDFAVGFINNENEGGYHLTNGSITISSHNGNNVVGTFSFTFSNETNTVTISNGSFNIDHL